MKLQTAKIFFHLPTNLFERKESSEKLPVTSGILSKFPHQPNAPYLSLQASKFKYNLGFEIIIYCELYQLRNVFGSDKSVLMCYDVTDAGQHVVEIFEGLKKQ